MICSKCGAHNPDYYVFCQNCFADLGDNASADTANIDLQDQDKIERQKPRTQTPISAYPPSVDQDAGIPLSHARDLNGQASVLNVLQNPVPKTQNNQQRTPLAPPDDYPPIYDQTFQYNHRDSEQENHSQSQWGQDQINYKPALDDMRTQNRYFDIQDQKESSTKAKNRKNQKKASREAREIQNLQKSHASAEYYDYYDYYDEAALKKERRRGRLVGILFWLVLLLIVVLAVALLSPQLFGSASDGNIFQRISSSFAGLFGGNDTVTVEAYIDEDGTANHRIFISGKKGEYVVFKEPYIEQAFEITSNNITPYKLPDSFWIPIEPVEDQTSLEVTPVIAIRSTDGTERMLDVPSYTVDVPQTSLTILEPSTLDQNIIENDTITISGTASSNSTEQIYVYVQGYELGSNVDENGNFTCQVRLNPGAFDIEIIAKAVRSRSSTVHVTGTSSGEIASITTDLTQPVADETLLVEGFTRKNVEFDVSGAASSVQYDSSSGAFSFTASLPKTGMHTFDIRVGSESQTLYIKRSPDVNTYTASARLLDFDTVLSSSSDYTNTIFYFEGTVSEVTEATDGSPIQKITLTLTSDSEKKVIIDYYGVVQPNIGETYRVYSTMTGTANQNTALTMDAYFMYTPEIVSSLSS